MKVFYAQLQQIDGKWNDKWAIMGRKWMKYMSISDGKMYNSMDQHLSVEKSLLNEIDYIFIHKIISWK